MKKLIKLCGAFVILAMVAMMSGCATTATKALDASQSSVELRSMQTRAFDTIDKEKMMRTVISTMQDLDFVIDKADYTLGSVTGSKFFRTTVITMTVTVRPRGEKQLLVRASAQYGIKSVKDAATYQDFFVALEKALFLTAHQVD